MVIEKRVIEKRVREKRVREKRVREKRVREKRVREKRVREEAHQRGIPAFIWSKAALVITGCPSISFAKS